MTSNVGKVQTRDVFGFGDDIKKLFKKVDDALEKATQGAIKAGIELEIGAGLEIENAIEQVKNAYRDELNVTTDKISKAAKVAFDDLKTMVEKFLKATNDELAELESEAQQLVDQLPFSNPRPLLRKVHPRFLVIDDLARASLVIFKGNFVSSGTPGFTPSLVFANKVCYLVDSNNQSLTFQVPHTAFNDTTANQYSYKTGELTIPWDDGYIFSHKTQSVFQVGLSALPYWAGYGTVLYRSSIADRLQNFYVNWKDCQLLIPQPNEAILYLAFVDYKGNRNEYASPELSGILKIAAEGNGIWKIWAEPPEELGLNAKEDLSEKFAEQLQIFVKTANLPKELRLIPSGSLLDKKQETFERPTLIELAKDGRMKKKE